MNLIISQGLLENPKGCYNDCYSLKTAKRYGIDFSKSIERSFFNEAHRLQIVRQIEKIDMDFIRIGCTGDPSENWEHTLNIIKQIRENSAAPENPITMVNLLPKYFTPSFTSPLGGYSLFGLCRLSQT